MSPDDRSAQFMEDIDRRGEMLLPMIRRQFDERVKAALSRGATPLSPAGARVMYLHILATYPSSPLEGLNVDGFYAVFATLDDDDREIIMRNCARAAAHRI